MLAGGFVVAMVTGYGAYHAHIFAGLVTSFAVGLRILVGVAFPKNHVLTLPLPSFASLPLGLHGVWRFISHMLGLAVLGLCAFAALTGWFSWSGVKVHSQISYAALSLISMHILLLFLMPGRKPPRPTKAGFR
ncbi:MAG: hypothetical protein HQL43_16825 [Alphaproteobacteria bacterium]|nr:hypothetical protein [Alphaproteobacteria bacterium]